MGGYQTKVARVDASRCVWMTGKHNGCEWCTCRKWMTIDVEDVYDERAGGHR